MIVFVIGNIASGKSTATRYLASRGAHRIDLDELAKSLYRPGSYVVDELVCAFGLSILDEAGSIDPAALARRAFIDAAHVQLLNDIVHPVVKQRLLEELDASPCDTGIVPRLVVVEISVPASCLDLFPIADEILAISVPLEVRRVRAHERGMMVAEFDKRAARQLSEEEICDIATRVIINLGTVEDLERALDAWLEERGCTFPARGYGDR